MSIVVMVDGGACLPKSILRRKDVVVVPLVVEQVDKSKVINSEEDLSTHFPLIHSPSRDDVEKTIRKYIEYGYDVLYITISSKLSKHYREILEISSMFDKSMFKVIDSLDMCLGEGLLVNRALECIHKGYGLKQVYNHLENIKQEIKSSYIIGDFANLYFQNKCDDIKNKYLEYCDSYPIIEIYNGVGKIAFDSLDLKTTYQILETNICDKIKENDCLFISAGKNNNHVQSLKKKLIKNHKEINVSIVEANPLLEILLGENGIGYSIINKESYS